MDFYNGRVTYHHSLDFSQLAAPYFNKFVYKIVQEYQRAYRRLVSTDGIKYSYQNPDNYLHHIRFFLDPEVTAAFVLICGLGYFGLDNPDVAQFLKLLFKATGQSPLQYRVSTSTFIDAFEFETYSNSLIFNTAPSHPGDPRIFSQSF